MKHRKRLQAVFFLVALGCGDRSALGILGTAPGLSDAGASGSGSSSGGETVSSSSGSGSSSGSSGSGSSSGGFICDCTGCCDTTNTCQDGMDPQACGLNGVSCSACESGQVCNEGVCGAPCPPATPTLCSGTCVDTAASVSNCGMCSSQCLTVVANATAACIDGTCTFTCNGGYTLCNGACVSGCGETSGSSDGGQCVAASCPACVLGIASCSSAGACQCCLQGLCEPG